MLVAAGPTLGRLHQAVDGLKYAVGDPGLEPTQHVIPMDVDSVHEVLKRVQLGAIDAVAPIVQVAGRGVGGKLPDVFEFELELVGAGDLAGGAAGSS